MDLCVILPVHNEKETIIAIINELIETIATIPQLQDNRIVVVDDCSDDGCIALLKGWWRDNAPSTTVLTIISLTCKHGLFNALLKGFKLVSTYNPRYTLTMDADGQDDPQIIAQLIAKDCDIVFASRGKRPESWFFCLGYQSLQLFLRIFTTDDARQGHFCLVKPAVVHYIASLGDIDYLGAKLATSGFNQQSIIVDRRPRLAGRSKFSFWKQCKTALIIISYRHHLLLTINISLFALMLLSILGNNWLTAVGVTSYFLLFHNLLMILSKRANSRCYHFEERVEEFTSSN